MSDAAAHASPPRRWTTRELLRWTAEHFRTKGLDAPRVCAEMLLAHTLDCERMRLYMDADRPASPEELARYRELVARAARHEPVQHLVGHAWFFSRRFAVDRSTLVPRPATEALVDAALRYLRERDLAQARILDLCTGSGCIAVSIAAQVPGARIVATDIVPAALDLARANAAGHDVADHIEFRRGSLWEALVAEERFDVICANPPYVSDAEWEQCAPNVRDWEPESALRGGPDGLDLVRPILAGAPRHLAPGALLLVEVAASHAAVAADLARAAGLREVAILRDDEGLDRVVIGRG